MKFTIDVSQYPKSYEIEAATKEEATAQARDRFYAETNGASIWTVEVTGQEN